MVWLELILTGAEGDSRHNPEASQPKFCVSRAISLYVKHLDTQGEESKEILKLLGVKLCTFIE